MSRWTRHSTALLSSQVKGTASSSQGLRSWMEPRHRPMMPRPKAVGSARCRYGLYQLGLAARAFLLISSLLVWDSIGTASRLDPTVSACMLRFLLDPTIEAGAKNTSRRGVAPAARYRWEIP